MGYQYPIVWTSVHCGGVHSSFCIPSPEVRPAGKADLHNDSQHLDIQNSEINSVCGFKHWLG